MRTGVSPRGLDGMAYFFFLPLNTFSKIILRTKSVKNTQNLA